MRSKLMAAALAVLASIGSVSRGEDVAHEDLSPCSGSAPEPAQSGIWGVAFCNRTSHDLVIQFHDNDCPAQSWGKRGDVYQKSIRRGESVIVPLCYANEPSKGVNPAPGIPTLRIPGGKGVVTTWNVVGDCGDRSDRLNLDARTFYDRGDYKTGIILLQYPAGAGHCVADAAAASRSQASSPVSSSPSAVAPPAAKAVAPIRAETAAATPAVPPGVDPGVTPGETPAAPVPQPPASVVSPKQPSLSVVVDTHDTLNRTVRILATSEQGQPVYKCTMDVALTFSDAATWTDRVRSIVPSGQAGTTVSTKRYLKSVSKAELTTSKCVPE